MKKNDSKPKKARPLKIKRFEKRTLPCKHVFAQNEKLELGDKMTAAMQTFEEVENQMKSISADYKARLKMIGTEVDQLANKFRDGYEMREIECIVHFNTATSDSGKAIKKVGTKRIVNALSKVFIRDEPMSPSDIQSEMFERKKIENDSKAARSKAAQGQQSDPPVVTLFNAPEMPDKGAKSKSTAAVSPEA